MPDTDESRVLDRNWNELLQELRVTQTGVQLLSGFLLTVPFSDRFSELDDVQRATYLAVFAGSVLSTAFIVAPVAFHRLLFRQRQRRWLVDAANVCARAGLATLSLTTSGILFLVFDLVLGRGAGTAALAVAVVVFTGLWAALPWAAHKTSRSSNQRTSLES